MFVAVIEEQKKITRKTTVESFNFMGANLRGLWGFADLRGCNFVDASVFSFGM